MNAFSFQHSSSSLKDYILHTISRFISDGCQQHTAALTYMTLISLVPLFSVLYSVLSWVPAFQSVGDQLQQFIFANFVPEASQEISVYLEDFSEQTRNLGGIGALILMVTLMLMMRNIEGVFNHIWAAPYGRKGLFSFLLYWAILSFGPLLLGLSIAVSTLIFSSQYLGDLSTLTLGWLLYYLPWLFSWMALTLIYFAVPNYRVPFRDALIGGFIAMIAFELAKKGFALIVAHSSYTSIYGAFATVPLFILWIYLAWSIVLFGAEIVRSIETVNSDSTVNSKSDFYIALQCLWILRTEQKNSKGVNDKLLLKQNINYAQWAIVRSKLLDNKIITIGENKNYVLLANLDELTLWQLMNYCDSRFTANNIEPSEQPWQQSFTESMNSIDSFSEQNMQQTVLALFKSQ